MRYIFTVNFALSDEEKLLQELSKKLAKRLREKAREMEKGELDAEVQRAFQEAELLKLDWEEKYGGGGLSTFAKGIVLEELAYGCAAATLALDRATLFTYPLRQGGVDPSFVASLVEREGWALLADSSLEGELDFPYLPMRKGGVLVGVSPKELSLFEISEGDEVLPLALHLLGGMAFHKELQPAHTFSSSTQLVERVRSYFYLYTSSLLSGVSQAALDYTLEYTQQREAFGKKIAHHQGVAFLLADQKIQVEALRLLNYRGAWGFDRGEMHFAPLAFVQAVESSLFVTNYGVQLLGGHGYIKDHPVEKWFREAQTLSLFWGGKGRAEMMAEQRYAQEGLSGF